MKVTWILVAHYAGAQIYEAARRGKDPRLIRDIPHPEGRWHNQDFDSDRHGTTHDRIGTLGHVTRSEHDPRDQDVQRFAAQLAGALREGWTQNQCERLVLVAEPGLLGDLRGALDAQTAARVVATLDKDLLCGDKHAMLQRLAELVTSLDARPHAAR